MYIDPIGLIILGAVYLYLLWQNHRLKEELHNARHPMPDPVAELHDAYRQAGISPEWAQEEAARSDAARPKRMKWPWQ
ncbi:MAG: hypothetical protein JWO19_5915 [Bryobacterales bacterium]|nr:hypothetical protein [Bryobacterales bacterium]